MSRIPSLRLPSHTPPSSTSWLKQKKTQKLQQFKTSGGDLLPDFDLGYETYGVLNEARDNVILICHYFSGSSHAAGRYTPQDIEPGYWDELIGPGKGIDTDKFFVVSVDILCNACPQLPHVKTVGPSTLNPQTQRPYGMSFPQITIADMVKSQKMILESLGIEKLYAVVGGSLGSMQAWQWAVDHPELVPRIIPVIGSGFETPPFVSDAVELWGRYLKLDPLWQSGDYSQESFPREGMISGLEMLTWNCLSSHWAEIYGAGAVRMIAEQRAQFIEPNHFLYIIESVQKFNVRQDLAKMKAKALIIAAESDFLMKPEFSIRAVEECQALGLEAHYAEIKGRGGHLDGLFAIGEVAPRIKEFLAN